MTPEEIIQAIEQLEDPLDLVAVYDHCHELLNAHPPAPDYQLNWLEKGIKVTPVSNQQLLSLGGEVPYDG